MSIQINKIRIIHILFHFLRNFPPGFKQVNYCEAKRKEGISTFNIWFCLIISNGKLKIENWNMSGALHCMCGFRHSNHISDYVTREYQNGVLNPFEIWILLYEIFIKIIIVIREFIVNSSSNLQEQRACVCVTHWNSFIIHCFHWILSIFGLTYQSRREIESERERWNHWMEIIRTAIAFNSMDDDDDDDIISSSFFLWQYYKWFIDSNFHILFYDMITAIVTHRLCMHPCTVCTALCFIISFCWKW